MSFWNDAKNILLFEKEKINSGTKSFNDKDRGIWCSNPRLIWMNDSIKFHDLRPN